MGAAFWFLGPFAGPALNARRAGALLCAPPMMQALRPAPRLTTLYDARGYAPLHSPRGGRSAPPPRVTFPSRRKSPKARQGLCPLESPRGTLRSPCGSRNPLDRDSDTTIDRFATLGLGANRSFFLSGFYGETFSAFNPWHGGAVLCRLHFTLIVQLNQ